MSNQRNIYLDYNATTPVHPEVAEIMQHYMITEFGNAGSVHSYGFRAHEGIRTARKTIADFLHCSPTEILFTSGGTEADNMALQGILYKKRRDNGGFPHLIVSEIEHPAVYETAKYLQKNGFDVTFLPADSDGFVDPEAVASAIRPNTALISLMLANNEIGTINPIVKIGQIAHDHEILFHTDAVQAFTKVPINPNDDIIDLFSVSAHKFYGPKGIGFLYVRNINERNSQSHESTARLILDPLMFGGSQEYNMRPATENVAGIVGLAKAVELGYTSFEEEIPRLIRLRDYLIKHILQEIPNTSLNGSFNYRLPHNINICFHDIPAYDLMVLLDNEGIACSVGAACHAGDTRPSRILLGIGRTAQEAAASLRFSIGLWTMQADLDVLLEFLSRFVSQLRQSPS